MFAFGSLQIYRQNISQEDADESFEAREVPRRIPKVDRDTGESQVGSNLFEESAGTAHEHVIAELLVGGIGQPAEDPAESPE
jgi:hypothetical protein